MPVVVLVSGPWGAGKTRWIRQQAGRRAGEWFHLSTDPLLDTIYLHGRTRRHYHPSARAFARALYQAGIQYAVTRGRNLYLESGAATRSERSARLLPFREPGWRCEIVVVRPANPATVIERIRADLSRPWSSYWAVGVHRWYTRHEPVGDDEADRVVVIED